MIEALKLLLLSAGLGAILMSFAFILAQSKRRYDLVDSAWGMTFLYIVLVHLYVRSLDFAVTTSGFIVVALVAVWALRLSSHIFSRFSKSDEQDPRYTEIISKWKGPKKVQVFFKIYVLQAILASIIVWPAVLVVNSLDAVSYLTYVGLAVWIIGFLTESIGDYQLKQFLKKPSNKGKLMQFGLWKYSRHPNYFGELAQWWGIGIICLNVPFGYLGLAGPLLLSWLIINVSGLPPAERRTAKKPGWIAYKNRTSALVPLPVKNLS